MESSSSEGEELNEQYSDEEFYRAALLVSLIRLYDVSLTQLAYTVGGDKGQQLVLDLLEAHARGAYLFPPPRIPEDGEHDPEN